ncbi:MAG: aconitate hydratase [Tindallia sp. MSAO_Bac2]|nr:MAG: aconitate hydratase [Tindallia sp. MSAO_Bac2]
MKKSLSVKIIESRLVNGNLRKGEEIAVKVNQTLTQDSTGTMVYLQLEAMDADTIQTDSSVAYVDHNMLQAGFENADDHAFIQSAAAKYGIIFSKPGNGICHQLHLERFGKPGDVLIGSDSHTPTGGGIGMLAIGSGGLDVAVGMAQGTYHLKMPGIVNIRLEGKRKPWVSAKDIILHILGKLTVKGGVNAILEYSGPGAADLTVPERATITNMGAELGATTSIFPSDDMTLDFLERQGRAEVYQPLAADPDAIYDETVVISLDEVTPCAAQPHSPDNVASLDAIGPISIDQVAIGSCTNGSYSDFMKVAAILKGRKVHPRVSLVISPGSSNILQMMAENGALADMISAGARLLEAGCGPCIGMGQAPKSGAVSLRTFNRNFKGRCGTMDAGVYLVSPETAAVSALTGKLTDPTSLGEDIRIPEPESYANSEGYWVKNTPRPDTPIEMGPNIKPFPIGSELETTLEAPVLLKTGDNVTTDDIMPSNAALLPLRSNIPALSNHCFSTIVSDFRERAQKANKGIVVGGDNYGQGSSREHAALVPLYLGVRAVIAKSFARIHQSNLVNAGILPLTFDNPEDYENLSEGDMLQIEDAGLQLERGLVTVINTTTGKSFQTTFTGSVRDAAMLKAGGALNYAAKGASHA